jgi:hypothetical protein
VSCHRAGDHYFSLREQVGARRNVSLAKALSVAISAAILFLMGSPIALAATFEEVARCRAMQVNTLRWQCFKSLRVPRQNTQKSKKDDTPKAQIEDPPRGKPEGVPKTEDAPNTKSEDAPPAVPEAAPDDPVTTSSIDYIRAAPGQPVCVDQDSLAAALIAGVLASNAAEAITAGCERIPEDAKIELLQRFPSSFHFLRIIKAKVIFPSQPDHPRIGYTVEIGR